MVRDAQPSDIEAMLELAATKRHQYAGYHPIFHRPAEQAREKQRPFFQSLISSSDFICLVSETTAMVDGFLIGHVVTAPPVYDPGGPTCIVDDFAVKDATAWSTIGAALLGEARSRAAKRGAVQLVVVTSPDDAPKRECILESGLRIVSEWAAGPTRLPDQSR